MLQLGHFCHPGFLQIIHDLCKARRRLIQQSQINFPSPPSLFLLSCGWRLSLHLCWDHAFYIWVFPRLPCWFPINGLAHQGLAKISQTNATLFVPQQTELAQSNALPTISVRLYAAWSMKHKWIFCSPGKSNSHKWAQCSCHLSNIKFIYFRHCLISSIYYIDRSVLLELKCTTHKIQTKLHLGPEWRIFRILTC